MSNVIAIGCDHAGFDLKIKILQHFKDLDFIDCGCDNAKTSVDYSDFANKVAQKINNNEANLGILICGSGVGISIAANRHKNIRAALCHSQKIAKLSRQHNDANILCLGARIVGDKNAVGIVKAFLKTKFAGGRHLKRVEKLG
jgi:ribose 5-phosphate isomerase B